MLLEKEIVKYAKKITSLEKSIREKNELFAIGSDATRLKILYLLLLNKGLCVTDLANIIGVSISAVSHQVRTLEKAGLIEAFKEGQTVCYEVVDYKRVGVFFEELSD